MKAIWALLVALATAGAPAQAATWPERPVRVIVALAPGGSVDIIARLVAGRLSERLGQQFVVDNRPGAGGTIGAAIAARANPDGYTLLMMSPAFASSAALHQLPYDPTRDIAPIVRIAAGPMFLAVHPSLAVSGPGEFVEHARARPGSLRYGSAGVGSSTHLATELLRQMTKTQLVHVPYKGIGAALADLLAGQIHFYIAPGAALLPHVTAGRLRMIAVTSEGRYPAMPALPALAESVPGYSAGFWYGLGAPAGIPKGAAAALGAAVARLVAEPETEAQLRLHALEPAHARAQEFARAIAREIALWAEVVRRAGIRLD